jgi:hypothetical protein
LGLCVPIACLNVNERRDDWCNGVDKKLVDLTSAQRSTDDELDELDLKYDSLDKIMRGDPENDIIGFHERLHTVETDLREIKAETIRAKIVGDSVQGIKWQSVTAIICAVIAALSVVLPHLDQIISVFHNDDAVYEPDVQLKKAIEADKRRHRKKKIIVHYVQPLLSAPTEQLRNPL